MKSRDSDGWFKNLKKLLLLKKESPLREIQGGELGI
jgi:hypothetical protein